MSSQPSQPPLSSLPPSAVLSPSLLPTPSPHGSWDAELRAAPRHLFVPDRIWVRTVRGVFAVVDRHRDPRAWAAAVRADAPVVTQLDDGRPNGPGVPTSCSTRPALLVTMLTALDVRLGQRVLDIGTGTGRTAALLAARVSNLGVVSVEVDQAVAFEARTMLNSAGYHPVVLTRDAADGYPEGGTFDRVVATAGVHRVPAGWIERTRPGGVLVLPYLTATGGVVLRLDVRRDGVAEGRVVGHGQVMPLRGQRPEAWARAGSGAAEGPRGCVVDPAVLEDPAVAQVLGLLVADARVDVHREPAGGLRVTVYGGDGSWAQTSADGDGLHEVCESGPRRLWREVEEAYRGWVEDGCPRVTRYGVSVAGATVRVWLGSPAAVRAMSAARAS